MADLQNFSITQRAVARINVPRATISARVVDSGSGAVLSDFTGANAILFPEVLETLTPQDQAAISEYIAMWLVQKKAGLI
jgi:hypothetical protein